MSQYTELKKLLEQGRITRKQLLDMYVMYNPTASDTMIDSLEELTDGQLIDMICIED